MYNISQSWTPVQNDIRTLTFMLSDLFSNSYKADEEKLKTFKWKRALVWDGLISHAYK